MQPHLLRALCLFIATPVILSYGSANAATVYEVNGVIANAEWIRTFYRYTDTVYNSLIGEPFTLHVVIDETAPDNSTAGCANTYVTCYDGIAGLTSTGINTESSGTNFYPIAGVYNDTPSEDSFFITASNGSVSSDIITGFPDYQLDGFQFGLIDDDAIAFSSLSLPQTLDLADFESSFIQINTRKRVGATSTSYIMGSITSVSISMVPVPPALYLFGSGLIGLIGMSRHAKSA